MDEDEQTAIAVAKKLEWRDEGGTIKATYQADAISIYPQDKDYPYYKFGVYLNGHFVGGDDTIEGAKMMAIYLSRCGEGSAI